ncbi:MAG: DotU family type IV/VI secretion system protein [Desulfovibrio sp.]|nr:DotU family type IV/VI secretion system protein [Desulfovibrio sp.]
MRRNDHFNEAIITAMLAARRPPHAAPVSPVPAGESGSDEDLTLASVLRGRLTRLLDEAVRRSVADGIDRELAETADFAVCAFIDETLLTSDWKERQEWMQAPLQHARHNTATAGEDFYSILDTLLQKAERLTPCALAPAAAAEGQESDRAEWQSLAAVLEVFALCLSQGFTGMLFDDAAAIRERLDKIGRFVPSVGHGLNARDGARLFPAAYPRAPARKDPLNRLRRFDALDWLLWIAPPAAVAALYYVYNLRLDALYDALTGRIPPP